MGLLLFIDESSVDEALDLCDRTGIHGKAGRQDGRTILLLDGQDEEYRYVLRRLESTGVAFSVGSLDGKELPQGF